MMMGWYRLNEPGSARSCPPLISEVYQTLQRPDRDRWTGLSQILLDPDLANLMDLGEADASHWWATPNAKIEEDPYYRMGALLLEGTEKVGFGS